MKPTITCKQPHLRSEQSGSKRSRQFLGLENEEDLPVRRQTTEICYSKLNKEVCISVRENSIVQKRVLRLVGRSEGGS